MIRSLEAFEQKLDFETIYPFTNICSDIDGVFQLNNGIYVILEVKKETENHSVENFLKSKQYQLIKTILGNREDLYFVYVTHQNTIDKNIFIEAADCTVKFVRHASNDYIIDSSITLTKFIKDLSRNKYLESTYYIMVKYPDSKMHYCIIAPEKRKWSSEIYNPEQNDFKSIKEVNDYIERRFLCGFNKDNEYWVFKKERDSTILVNISKYQNKFIYSQENKDSINRNV